MALIQWHQAFEPFRDLRELQDRVNRLFEDGSGDGVPGVERGTGTFPPLDIREDKDFVYVVAELPGVALEALDVSITGDTLAIKGERKAPAVKEDGFHRQERAFGHFNRQVSLPDRVDAEKIAASLKDGILRITLPKAESAKPRAIKIEHA